MSAFGRLALPISVLWVLAATFATGDTYAQGSKGENYSDKPPAVLFNSDCTGSGCHNGPQGLARGKSVSELSSYLREHYTNSRQSAAALASYLAGVPGANARTPRPGRENSEREMPARETPARESSKREPLAREQPKQEESSSIFPSLPLFPFFSSPPETAKSDEPPPRSRSRTGKRNEGSQARPTETKRDQAPPQSPPTEAKREENAKPKAEGEAARPARARSRQPSNQIPNTDDSNSSNSNGIYRPAKPRQPITEDEAKPSETTVMSVPANNAPANTPGSAPANAPSTTATATPPSPPVTPTQANRARARQSAAELGNSAPTEAAKPQQTRGPKRPPNSAAAAQSAAAPSNAPSSSQPASGETGLKPREQIFD